MRDAQRVSKVQNDRKVQRLRFNQETSRSSTKVNISQTYIRGKVQSQYGIISQKLPMHYPISNQRFD
jgi:hypothetical protein